VSKPKLTKEYLDKLYKQYNRINSAEDPAWNILVQNEKLDKEILAFISAIYAFGSIKQIINSQLKIFGILTPSAYQRILDRDYLLYIEKNFEVKHRFLFHKEFIGLLKTLNLIYTKFGSIKKLFLLNYNPHDKNLKNAISHFSKNLRDLINGQNLSSRKIKFLFPSPEDRSPCKRINLFLRWMVRKDNIDFGLWNEIKPSQLIIPLDVHIYNAARKYQLTKLKSPSWKMAEEITESLKKFDPVDPVKYDFVLSHLKIK